MEWGYLGGCSKNLSRYFLLQTQHFWDFTGEGHADTHIHQIHVIMLKMHTSGQQ